MLASNYHGSPGVLDILNRDSATRVRQIAIPAIVLSLILAACTPLVDSEKPVEGAELWMDAALNGRDDDLRARTCEEGRDQMWIFPLTKILLDPSGGFLALAEALMPADTFDYTELENDDGWAVVEVSTPQNFLMEPTQFHFWMKKEGSEWHWCGGEEP